MNTMTATSALTYEFDTKQNWVDVCEVNDLSPDTGVCALVAGQQVAIFYAHRINEYFAIGNYDPIGRANVLSRGIIGSVGDSVVVASPLYKQHFNLRTGDCLEQPEHKLTVYTVRTQDGWIEVKEPSKS